MALVLKLRKPDVEKLQSKISVDGSVADFAYEDKWPTGFGALSDFKENSLSFGPPVV